MPNIPDFKKAANHPLALVAIAALFYTFFIASLLVSYQFDVSRFIVLGDKFTKAADLPTQLHVMDNSWGYDGQFYYRLALDPFTKDVSQHGITLDLPSLRQQRIMYPFLVWLFSGGNSALVPILMLLVNYFGVLIIAWLVGVLAKSYGYHVLWGSILVFYPGLLLTIARDLTEIVALAFILGSIFFYRRHWYILFSLCLTAAALSRETAIFVAVGFAVVACYRYIKQKSLEASKLCLAIVIPITIFASWQLYLSKTWDVAASSANLRFNLASYPFEGMLSGLTQNLNPLYWNEVGLLFMTLLFTSASIRKSNIYTALKLAWLIYLILFLMLSHNVWVEDWSFLRVSTDFFALGALLLLAKPRNYRLLIPSLSIVLAVSLWLFSELT